MLPFLVSQENVARGIPDIQFQRGIPDIQFPNCVWLKIHNRNALALAALNAKDGIGDDVEPRETPDYLMRAVDEDRMSDLVWTGFVPRELPQSRRRASR